MYFLQKDDIMLHFTLTGSSDITGCQYLLFCLLLAGIWYMMWANIGQVAEHKDTMEFMPSPRRSIDSGTGKLVNDGLFLFADCRSAIKGVFLGE